MADDDNTRHELHYVTSGNVLLGGKFCGSRNGGTGEI